jgi:hypothetical protein
MRSTRIVHAAAAVALVALALPALASANLYCVNEPACVKAGGTNEGTEETALHGALANAEAHSGSTVVIGAGTYTRAKGFEYSGVPVTIRGAGSGSTILTTPSEVGGYVFKLNSASATLSNVGVAIAGDESQRGMELRAGTVEHVSISGGGGKDIPTGLAISGGVFSDGSIEMSEAETSNAVAATGGEVIGSTITGSYGVDASVATTIRGCRISSYIDAVDAYYTKPLIVEDTLIYVRGPAPAMTLVGNANGNATATLRGLTILDANGTEAGIEVEANRGASSTATLEDSVIDNFEHPIAEANEESGSKVSMTTDYSSYEASLDKQEERAGGTVPAPPSDENPVSDTPDFIHPVFDAKGFTEGNWALLASSPLIGAGSPSSLAAGEYALDAAGNPRIVDGARDVGAFEYQRGAPVVSASASSATATVGQAVSFSGSASVTEPGDAIAGYQWTFDDGASVAPGATATHAFATAGTHTATLTATDVVGVQGTAVVSVTVLPHLYLCGCIPPPPVIWLAISPRAFRAARRGASIALAPTGGRVSFPLRTAGSVRFTVEQLLAGVVHGRSCVSPSRGSTHAKRCTRDVLLHGSFAHAGFAGANSLRFTGRLHGRALAPGSYLLIAAYSGAAGRASASAPFRIVG